MSPRAAARLETLGFEDVSDYVAGKVDWLANGLPTEGHAAGTPRVAALVRRDVVTCRLDDDLAQVRQRIAASEYGFALVLGQGDVLLGRLRGSTLRTDAGSVEDLMEPGPSTVRAHLSLADARQQLSAHDLHYLLVTTPEGVLIGVLRREDAEGEQAS